MNFINSTLRYSSSIAAVALALSAATNVAHGQAAGNVSFSTVYTFNNDDIGFTPDGPLTQGTDGSLYGTSPYGGAHSDGVVFKIASDGTSTPLYSFSADDVSIGNSDGSTPSQGVVQGSDGNFYGVTHLGGSSDNGVIFKLTPSGALTVLHNFIQQGHSVEGCSGQLTEGSDGNFYGAGGFSNGGASYIFKMTPSGTLTPIYTFTSDPGDDVAVVGKLIFDSAGNLYGVTGNGGTYGQGSIFKLAPNDTLTTLYSFSGGTDGSEPSSVTLGSDGSLYGETSSGGEFEYGFGTIYRLSPSGVLTTLHSFNYVDGTGGAPLVQGSNGYFYGTSNSFGPNDVGTVFQITPTGAFTTLYAFLGTNPYGPATTDGNYPTGLVQSSDGSFYGLANQGGLYGLGTLFKVTSTHGSGERFDYNNDGYPDLLWYNTASGDISTWFMDDQQVLTFGLSFSQVAPGSGWVPVGAPDINGDGYPDLLWWNSHTGELSAWTMSGTSVINYGSDFAQVSDTNWKPVAIGDMQGAAYNLVFQNTATGDISRWRMNGTDVVDYGDTIESLGANSSIKIVGAPDLDGDGMSDLLLWDSQTGDVSWWGCDLTHSTVNSMNSDISQVTDTSWHLVGSEDTNGDGHPDLVWWNANSGIESRWLLNGTTVTQYGGVSTQVPDTTWQPTAIR